MSQLSLLSQGETLSARIILSYVLCDSQVVACHQYRCCLKVKPCMLGLFCPMSYVTVRL